MLTPPTIAPAQIAVGDTAIWSRTFDDYPSNLWTLKYTLVSATVAYNFSATGQADGSYLVTVDDTTTAAWVADQYKLIEYVELTAGGQRFTFAEQPLLVLPDLAGATAGVDTRSHARKMLDLIQAYFEKKLPGQQRILLDGLRIDSFTPAELLLLRDRYRVEVAREDQLASGAPAPRLLVNF